MRRIIALLAIFLIIASCSNQLKFNTPAFQGTKNYSTWIADNYQAAIVDEGSLKVIAAYSQESITMYVENIGVGTYNLGPSTLSYIEFDDETFNSYSTLNNGNGQIIIEDYDIINLTISGSFKFNAYSSNGEVVNFNTGVFYKIPIAHDDQVIEFEGSNLFGATVNDNPVEVATIMTSIDETILNIKSTNVDGTYIELFMPEDILVGSYTLNFSTQIYGSYVDLNSNVALSQYGTLSILEHDQQFKRIKGNFLFNTGNPYNVVVSNGSFIVYY